MVVTNIGLSGDARLMTPSGASKYPQYCMIGSGSGSALVTCTGLYSPVKSALYSSYDISTLTQTQWTWDFSSVAMSGIILTNFGSTSTSGVTYNDVWQLECFANTPVTFDGTNELQIQITWEKY